MHANELHPPQRCNAAKESPMFSFGKLFGRTVRSSRTQDRVRPRATRKVARPRQLEVEGLEERMVLSPVRGEYSAMGGQNGFVGYATTAEPVAPDGIGHYQYFQDGAIYWSPATGAHEIHGAIRNEWASIGWERSVLGYPTSDESYTTGGRYNSFQGGFILWSPASGAHEVHGAILSEYAAIGWQNSPLGFP